jgi:hypothetical protein
MEEEVHVLVSVKLKKEFSEQFDVLSPEDAALYFVENLQSDYDGAGVEFEVLEVY